jgi:hypothetical protein
LEVLKMAKSSFTNEQLVTVWFDVAQRKGTRREVVVELMKQLKMDPKDSDEYKKMYNNVTQRKKSLEKRSADTDTPIKFAELAVGARGNKADKSEIAKLAALMAGAGVEQTEGEDSQPETAEQAEAETETEEVAVE